MKLEKKSNSLSSFFSLVVLCAWIFLAFFGYRMVLRCNQEMERYSRLVNIELERDGPDGVAVQRMQEVEAEQEEPLSFTFWTSLGERKLEARTTGVIQQSQVYMLWGPSEVFLLGATGLLPTDTKGCLIDEKAAYELFGSKEVSGQEVDFDGEIYQIRNVVPGWQGIFLIQGYETRQTFTDVTVLCADKGERIEKVRQFLLRCQLEGRIADEFLGGVLSKCFLLFLPLLAVIRWIFFLQSQYKKVKRSEIQRLFYRICIWVTVLLFLVAVLGIVEIPRDMIPDKWSDFAFWTRQWKEKTVSLSYTIQGAKSPGQMLRLQNLFRECLYSIFSGIAGWRAVSCFSLAGIDAPAKEVKRKY